jgi:chromate transport protein ChrA
MRATEKLTSVAAAMSALATLACCLPLGIAGAAGALGLSIALERLRPWLISLAVILLGVSAFQMYRGQKRCKQRSRLSLIFFGLCAAVVLAVMIFPQILAELLAALQ